MEFEINDTTENIIFDTEKLPVILVDNQLQKLSSGRGLPKAIFYGKEAPCECTRDGKIRYCDYMSAFYQDKKQDLVAEVDPKKRIQRKLANLKKQEQKLIAMLKDDIIEE